MKKEKFITYNENCKISGTKYIPENGNNIPVVMSHGFLSNQKFLKKYAMFLCNLGYCVYTFDFCGGSTFGKSEKDRTYMTLSHELKDIESVISKVNEDKDKLILFGESQGGFLSLVYASQNKDKVNKVLCIYPALCIPDDARKGKMLFMEFDPDDIDNTFKCSFGFHFNKQYAKEAQKMNLEEILSSVKCPCCIVAGDKDQIVNSSYPLKAKDLLSEESKIIFIKDAGHGFKGSEIDEANGYFAKFLKQ